MDVRDWMTLLVAVAAIAGALVLEHVLVGHRHWPARWYYALGLMTVLAGLLAWGMARGVRLGPVTCLALFLAGCASGVPDFLLLRVEEARRERAWATLEASNAELAGQLRLLLSKPVNSNYMRRLREMVETAAFATAAMQRERELVELAERQAGELLAQIRDLVGEGEPCRSR